MAHLGYAHPPQWSMYYAEALPAGAAVVAAGATACLTVLMRRLAPTEPARRAMLLLRLAAFVAIVGRCRSGWRRHGSTSRSRASR